ncbi:rhodanese-like domain-containing protein [Sorangium sp. So ce887]|uniref:rhodanese-like domain-containing protein n=1 Tax=Sorangium sp. So ce887 TaxID=3133324 RepID=UPI003F61A508
MADIKRVSPEQAKKLIDEEGYLYLDVRSEPEYGAGHPSGAHNVPLLHAAAGGMKPNQDFLDVVCSLYPKDAKIIVGCRSGQRSMRAAEAMVSAGYTAVIDQRAGFEGPRDAFGALTEKGWGPAGLPVETTTPGASYAELQQKAGR